MLDPRIEPRVPFTESQLLAIEKVIGRALPADYREFVRVYGAAFVGGLIDGDEEMPILDFKDPDSIFLELDCNTELKNAGAVPFARCALNNLWVFDKKNRVHYIDYYGGETKTRKVADNFSDFFSRWQPTRD